MRLHTLLYRFGVLRCGKGFALFAHYGYLRGVIASIGNSAALDAISGAFDSIVASRITTSTVT